MAERTIPSPKELEAFKADAARKQAKYANERLAYSNKVRAHFRNLFGDGIVK